MHGDRVIHDAPDAVVRVGKPRGGEPRLVLSSGRHKPGPRAMRVGVFGFVDQVLVQCTVPVGRVHSPAFLRNRRLPPISTVASRCGSPAARRRPWPDPAAADRDKGSVRGQHLEGISCDRRACQETGLNQPDRRGLAAGRLFTPCVDIRSSLVPCARLDLRSTDAHANLMTFRRIIIMGLE